MSMLTNDLGKRIDGVSAELHGLSLLCERLAEELTGRPGPRSHKSNEVQPNSAQQLKAKIAAWVKRWDSASKDPYGLREFPSIDELRQLSAD